MPFNLVVVLILLGGWLFGRIFSKIGLPTVLEMVVWGVCIGLLWKEAVAGLTGYMLAAVSKEEIIAHELSRKLSKVWSEREEDSI
jgi:Kef-type K+ transport system membrane component KefB